MSMKLRHVVLFGFKAATTAAAIAETIRRFAELKVLVPDIDDFEWARVPAWKAWTMDSAPSF
jgi:hypothetical protein